MDLPVSLVDSLLSDIEAMGDNTPLSFKSLWGYLMAESCTTCKTYGVDLCTLHGQTAREVVQ